MGTQFARINIDDGRTHGMCNVYRNFAKWRFRRVRIGGQKCPRLGTDVLHVHGKLLTSISEIIYSSESSNSWWIFKGHSSTITTIRVMSDNRRAVSIDKAGNLFIWAVDNGTKLFSAKGASTFMDVTSNMKYLVYGDGENWSVRNSRNTCL